MDDDAQGADGQQVGAEVFMAVGVAVFHHLEDPQENAARHGPQQDYIEEGRQDLQPTQAECPLRRGRQLGIVQRGQGHDQRPRVGHHVAGMGQQREAAREHAPHDVHHHVDQQQHQGCHQAAPARAAVVVVVTAKQRLRFHMVVVVVTVMVMGCGIGHLECSGRTGCMNGGTRYSCLRGCLEMPPGEAKGAAE